MISPDRLKKKIYIYIFMKPQHSVCHTGEFKMAAAAV